MFSNGLDRKQALQNDKNTHFSKSEKWGCFPKGLTHAYSQKIQFCFFLD